MKRVLSLVLVAALAAAMFTGCGCSANVSDHPGGMITEEATIMPRPTATHTTEPRETTLPRATDAQGMNVETGESTMPGGTTGGTTTPTDATVDPRARNRNTAR